MSIISTIAELFRRSAVPSIESTLSQGGSRERAIENLRNLIGPDVTISQQIIGTTLSRVQQALQRGAAINRGETVPRQFIPIDPTIPIGTEYRYRVRIEANIPDPEKPGGIRTIDQVIPIDSEINLSTREIRQMALPAARELIGQGRYPHLSALGIALTIPGEIDTRITIISVYRSPIG